MPVNVGGYEITKEMENAYSQYVKSGLALHLDAGIAGSYPGSGTSWYDLSSNGLVFTSNGTQTPYEIKAGVPSFAFNGSGYWTCNSGIDMAGDCTLIMMVYSESLAARKTIFEKAGTIYQSYEQEIAVTYEVAQGFSWYSRQGDYDFGGTPNMDLNNWNMMAIKMSSGKVGGVARTGFQSKNGAAWVSSYTSRSTNAIVTAGEMRIGTGYAGTVTDGNIGMVMVYEKMLSDSEIAQNYKAMRTRYGI
jgi:hypothetical protein